MKAVAAVVVAMVACGTSTRPLAPGGVVFTFPRDRQLDVPLGAPVIVTFSDPVDANAVAACSGTRDAVVGAICLVGPDGPVTATAELVGDRTVRFTHAALAPGATYAVYARPALVPTLPELPDAALLSFTTRSMRATTPELVAVNGAPPATPESFRPLFESSTIRLVFSEPLDPRTTQAIALVDTTTGVPVPATVIASGIHVSVDPASDLVPGTTYRLDISSLVTDLGGVSVAPTSVTLVPRSIGAAHPIIQVLRPRAVGDPGRAGSYAGGDPNVIAIAHPLIGSTQSQVMPNALVTELGDPTALDGPFAFTIRRGQRLRATGLDVKLGGEVPAGLATGDIVIELLTDGGGRLYRDPYRAADQLPDNDRAPLFVDLSMDVAVYAVDPTGNAVLTQTVLGLQATGTAVAANKVLDLEAVIAMDLDLLGVARAPTNLVLELITDPTAQPEVDRSGPTLVASRTGDPTELIFSEPIDLDRARGGGLRLETAAGQVVPAAIESAGAAVLVHPLTPLVEGTSYQVKLEGVTDLAGNRLAAAAPLAFTAPSLVATNAPLTVAAVHPGVPCALTAAGRCVGAGASDDAYHPFALPADQPIDVAFTQAPSPASVVRGTACNTGSVRIEQLDDTGACVAAVPGTLVHRGRRLTFEPARPWRTGSHYRLRLISGTTATCVAGALCGLTGVAPSFDPLGGNKVAAAGGPDLVIEFTGAPASGATFMLTETTPFTDANGSGFVESSEAPSDANRAALRIVRTGGVITAASFNQPDCVPGTPEVEACMYLSGTMAVELAPLAHDCALPGGTTVASCVPVTLSPQAMVGTSLALKATAFIDPSTIDISTVTGMAVMRLREPPNGQTTGYLFDDHGVPTLVVTLTLYLDEPDMNLPLMQHDLHSRALTVELRGPVHFQPDGRIAISVTNTADVPVTIGVSATNVAGALELTIPIGGMKIQLVSPPVRGGL